ncbi:hypothetical protein B0I31_103423 [Saccharothrix carnea]|uniref:Uncharacterized protein n=1 Tax=Saccharothrix carnea TaxID=1280637 RepID=A0A2P8IDW6_SACCR|nr:hypothetical protein B0I31_103423 [Saccharothrix carnea]
MAHTVADTPDKTDTCATVPRRLHSIVDGRPIRENLGDSRGRVTVGWTT